MYYKYTLICFPVSFTLCVCVTVANVVIVYRIYGYGLLNDLYHFADTACRIILAYSFPNLCERCVILCRYILYGFYIRVPVNPTQTKLHENRPQTRAG